MLRKVWRRALVERKRARRLVTELRWFVLSRKWAPVAERKSGEITKLVVLGNSITKHGPLPSAGWVGNWGMAASAQDRDFAHTLGAMLRVPVTAVNVASIEMDPKAPLPQVQVDTSTLVVVALGDNGLAARYQDLLRLVSGAGSIACTSTYWRRPVADLVMQRAARSVGATWVHIGDIYKGAQGAWTNMDVARHPADADMHAMARRVFEAVTADARSPR
ncbi:hypothetical protein [Roseateles sp.]|uniref:hypothetical protein n=1 Tax=Roseateles sp. TaxID=1971397 RepID=UPI0031E489D5